MLFCPCLPSCRPPSPTEGFLLDYLLFYPWIIFCLLRTRDKISQVGTSAVLLLFKHFCEWEQLCSVLNVRHCLSLFIPQSGPTNTHIYTQPQGFCVRTNNIFSRYLKKYSQYFQLLGLFQPFVKCSLFSHIIPFYLVFLFGSKLRYCSQEIYSCNHLMHFLLFCWICKWRKNIINKIQSAEDCALLNSMPILSLCGDRRQICPCSPS